MGGGTAGTPIRDKIKCSKLEDFPTYPSSRHPCPSPPMAIVCPWSHPVESRSVAVRFHLLPFLGLQLRLLNSQSPPPISHCSLCAQCTLFRHTLPHPLHTRAPSSSRLPKSWSARGVTFCSLVRSALGPSGTAGWFQLPSAQFLHRGIWASQADVYSEVKDEGLVLHLWSH